MTVVHWSHVLMMRVFATAEATHEVIIQKWPRFSLLAGKCFVRWKAACGLQWFEIKHSRGYVSSTASIRLRTSALPDIFKWHLGKKYITQYKDVCWWLHYLLSNITDENCFTLQLDFHITEKWSRDWYLNFNLRKNVNVSHLRGKEMIRLVNAVTISTGKGWK